jgi:hypothetical protein
MHCDQPQLLSHLGSVDARLDGRYAPEAVLAAVCLMAHLLHALPLTGARVVMCAQPSKPA